MSVRSLALLVSFFSVVVGVVGVVGVPARAEAPANGPPPNCFIDIELTAASGKVTRQTSAFAVSTRQECEKMRRLLAKPFSPSDVPGAIKAKKATLRWKPRKERP